VVQQDDSLDRFPLFAPPKPTKVKINKTAKLPRQNAKRAGNNIKR
jgi:hypothetical protein